MPRVPCLVSHAASAHAQACLFVFLLSRTTVPRAVLEHRAAENHTCMPQRSLHTSTQVLACVAAYVHCFLVTPQPGRPWLADLKGVASAAAIDPLLHTSRHAGSLPLRGCVPARAPRRPDPAFVCPCPYPTRGSSASQHVLLSAQIQHLSVHVHMLPEGLARPQHQGPVHTSNRGPGGGPWHQGPAPPQHHTGQHVRSTGGP